MNDYVETRGLRLTTENADAYERDLKEADRGGNSRQRRDAEKRIHQLYETLHVEAPTKETEMFTLWGDTATDEERDKAIRLILEHLQMKIVQTNATRNREAEMTLRPID